MTESRDVLIFAEDPGAANYVAGLPTELVKQGLVGRLFLSGFAVEHLRARGAGFDPVGAAEEASGLLSRIHPSVIVTGTSENPDSFGLKLIEAARFSGIPSIAVVDALSNATHRFRGRLNCARAYAPDWLVVADEWTRDAYIALGFRSDRVRVCGHPHYDHVLKEKWRLEQVDRAMLRKRMFPGAPHDCWVVVLVSELSSGLDPSQYRKSASYTLVGRGCAVGRTEIVMEEFLDAAADLNPKPWKVLRLHPKNTETEFVAYMGEFDQVSRAESSLELIWAADAVVGMTSMPMIEAALLGRPTLSIVPRMLEAEWLPTIRAGVTPCAVTQQAVREEMARLGGSVAVHAELSIMRDSLHLLARLVRELFEGRSHHG